MADKDPLDNTTENLPPDLQAKVYKDRYLAALAKDRIEDELIRSQKSILEWQQKNPEAQKVAIEKTLGEKSMDVIKDHKVAAGTGIAGIIAAVIAGMQYLPPKEPLPPAPTEQTQPVNTARSEISRQLILIEVKGLLNDMEKDLKKYVDNEIRSHTNAVHERRR